MSQNQFNQMVINVIFGIDCEIYLVILLQA